VNPEAVSTEQAANLLPKYSQKTLSVKNVASTDAWYITNKASSIESRVFAPSSAHTPGETPIAMVE
jgi:hypothetical protein